MSKKLCFVTLLNSSKFNEKERKANVIHQDVENDAVCDRLADGIRIEGLLEDAERVPPRSPKEIQSIRIRRPSKREIL